MKPKDMKGLVSGQPEFVALWNRICDKSQLEQDEWIAHLRSAGVKASHPNDGWVDRDNFTLNLVYPDFDDGVDVGDLVALGRPNDYYIVKITKKTDQLWGSADFSYERLEEEAPKKKRGAWWQRIIRGE